MAFSNLFFVLVFLPVFLIVYMLSPGIVGKNRALLVFSLIFYAFGGLKYLLLLLILTAVGWFLAQEMDKKDEPAQKKPLLTAGVGIALAVLGIFKYTGFFLGTLGSIFGAGWAIPQIVLPLGISFYVFKLISYLADVYRGKCSAESRYGDLLLYTATFHHVTQGPILRYPDLAPQLTNRKFTRAGFADGIQRFCLGLAKKVILADHAGALADALIPLSGELASQPTAAVWLGSLCYTLQIYLDFSAYTDMALGLGQMLGFRYPENFDYPYIAVSVRDFWRRWHISLSQFFRDYVYIPLGGNRVSPRTLARNLLVVWALTGLWHGSSWNFVLWGLYYFLFITLENWWTRTGKPHLPAVLGHIYTILVFSFGWILFRFTDFGQLGRALTGFLGLHHNGFTNSVVSLNFRNNLFFLIVAILACTPLCRKLGEKLALAADASESGETALRVLRIVIAVLLLVWSVFSMAGNTYTPFLYNQF